jgi:hypothetical protein
LFIYISHHRVHPPRDANDTEIYLEDTNSIP